MNGWGGKNATNTLVRKGKKVYKIFLLHWIDRHFPMIQYFPWISKMDGNIGFSARGWI